MKTLCQNLLIKYSEVPGAGTLRDQGPHCTVVNKGIIIEILDFELGAFSENLKHLMTWKKGIFGFSLQKKKFQLRGKCVVKPIFFHFYLENWTFCQKNPTQWIASTFKKISQLPIHTSIASNYFQSGRDLQTSFFLMICIVLI